jgi:hypothetical protein
VIGVPEEPSVGDAVWWRGMRFVVTEVTQKVVSYKNDYYTCSSAKAEMKWNDELSLWYLPGVEGRMPKLVRGEIIDPPLPRCIGCGAVTFRRDLCTTCRLKEE